MGTRAQERPMARKRPKRNDLSAKIEASILRDAKWVASDKGITLAQYLSDLLREPVARDYREMLTRRSKELPGG